MHKRIIYKEVVVVVTVEKEEEEEEETKYSDDVMTLRSCVNMIRNRPLRIA